MDWEKWANGQSLSYHHKGSGFDIRLWSHITVHPVTTDHKKSELHRFIQRSTQFYMYVGADMFVSPLK